jgi:hypothetical protein
MGINWGGFIKGVSDYGLERLKEERTLKMQQQLMELQDKYKQAEELREYERKKREVTGSRQSADDPMMVEDVNIEGEVLRKRARSASDIKAEEQSDSRFKADLENLYSQIQHRKDQIGVERERNAILRARNSSGIDGLVGGDGDLPTSDEAIVNRLANDLVAGYKWGDIKLDSPEGIQNAARIRELARQTAWSAIRAGNPDLAQEMFDRAVVTSSGLKRPDPFR